MPFGAVALATMCTLFQLDVHGVVIDARTRAPIPGVRILADSLMVGTSALDGSFDLGSLATGVHVLLFEHVAYLPRRIALPGTSPSSPMVIELEPRLYRTEPVRVEARATVPSLPVSAVEFDREATELTAGNIASDPLRTVQAHPSASTAGIDFLSAMSIRAGDVEEHRVYIDGLPLRHYAHLGGFSSVVYDDMLQSTTLIPGASPPRYHGTLSGVILFETQSIDSNLTSLRYDITSLAAGANRVVSPSLGLQVAAKTSTFNLPVYQQVGVDERSFRDLLARAEWSPSESVTVTPTVVVARDSETSSSYLGVGRDRETTSVLAGVEIGHDRSTWEFALRPYYSYYESSDELTWSDAPRLHQLDELRIAGEVSKQGARLGATVTGEIGSVRHDGYGSKYSDTPFAAAAEGRWLLRETAAIVAGAGLTREEWTDNVAPEFYGSLRINAGAWMTLQGAARRSHQSPVLYSERRFFASIPIDAGDLLAEYAEPQSVQMDQLSVEARLNLPWSMSLEGNGFWREYDALPAWEWSTLPFPRNVTGAGTGHGDGYEVVFARHDPDLISLAVTASRARVWKREGTLATERIGDYDKPDAWQATTTVRLSRDLRLSLRWTDVAGLPFTQYESQSVPALDAQVNAERLDRFQRLDVKLSVDAFSDPFHVSVFIDFVNLLGTRNIATMYALETSPGEFTTVPYGGTAFFPIGGFTARW